MQGRFINRISSKSGNNKNKIRDRVKHTEMLQAHKYNWIEYNIKQHSKIKTNKIWQKQDHKHKIFHDLQPLRLCNNQQPIQQAQQMPHLNWSHFKPEF